MTTGGYTLLKAPRPTQKLVHVHAGAEELGPRLCRRPDAAGGDGGCAAKALEALAPPPRLPLGRVDRWRTRRLRGQPRRRCRSSRSTWREVVKTIQRLAPADSVLTNGAGNFSGWLHRYYRYPGLQHGGRTQLAPTSGAMGYGVPAAVAAALLHPERHRDQHRRRRRLPDDRPGARDGDRLRRRPRRGPADQHRRRQRHLRHDPHAPGARVPRARQRQRPVQPRLRRARAGLRLACRAGRQQRPNSSPRSRPRWSAAGRPCCT